MGTRGPWLRVLYHGHRVSGGRGGPRSLIVDRGLACTLCGFGTLFQRRGGCGGENRGAKPLSEARHSNDSRIAVGIVHVAVAVLFWLLLRQGQRCRQSDAAVSMVCEHLDRCIVVVVLSS